jgi:subtilisin family serine protease
MATTTHRLAANSGQNFRSGRGAADRLLRLAGIGLVILLSLSGALAEPRFVPGRILVRPRAGLKETNFAGKLKGHNGVHRRTLRHGNVCVVTVAEDRAEAALAELRRDPDIEFAERDYLAEAAFLPNDPSVVSGDAWHLAQIQAVQAWNLTTGRSNVVVAVLDSGINPAHPDLSGQLLPGYDFVNNDPDPADDFGHGTAVSGVVVAAGNNRVGVAGVAYGCRVLPVKVIDASGFAAYSCLAQGIHYAVDQGARVVNISIVGSAPSAALQDAMDYAWSNNVVIVAAAGNTADAAPQYPAACDHVISVSATEPDDSLAGFSSYGSTVTLGAPGDSIWTTQNHTDNLYGAWRGTSFASPLVAGVAALVASENPSLSNTQIVAILEQTADDIGAVGYDPLFGYGRVNAFSAVTVASLEPGALPPQTPMTLAVNLASPVPTQAISQNVNPAPEADTVSGPFARAKGRYAGLMAGTNGVLPDNAGYFRLTVTAAGRFTGKLAMGGRRYGFHGTLDPSGDASVMVKRGKLKPLALTLHLDLVHGTDEIIGSVTDGDWTSELSGGRNIFHAKSNPARQAGARAFILARADESRATAATGLSTLSKSGAARVKGRLTDGRAFSAASLLTRDGDCPFYLSFSKGSEVVIGWLNFPASPAPTASGTVLWVRTGTNAFAATLQAALAP